MKFIGLGLHDENGISLAGLREARDSDVVFVELYTSAMPGLSLKRLEELLGKPVLVLSRREVEEEAEERILKVAKGKDVAFLTPGDPMNATTHVDLRLRAERAGVKTRVIHAASIFSAIAGATGLQSYKFGKAVTVPIVEVGEPPETPYNVIAENKRMGLHTLVLLDFNAETGSYLTVQGALRQLMLVEERARRGVATPSTLVVVAARVGSPDMKVRGTAIAEALKEDFGGPPISIVFPGRLHFVEAEALRVLAGTKPELLEGLE